VCIGYLFVDICLGICLCEERHKRRLIYLAFVLLTLVTLRYLVVSARASALVRTRFVSYRATLGSNLPCTRVSYEL